ncbi:CehA/McbA family metallohydrolase [Halocalculus aciditolerans]|uniref:Phosphoesterase n=1 Tax=Halocalculus aciditolerans TaxID=1383812 RepID=A0A830F2V9_9EURY|nr:PHP domain-containing protein [Halocalculus aciditolerans]GGL57174.1 phosphoesterase [Halocalculus aciditolerans]
MADSTTTVRVDPHVHSDGSYDGHEPVELLLEHAADVGLDAVVVTDHDDIDESLRAADLASDYGLLGIPGVEVSTAHGHLLAVGVEECPPKGEPLAATVDHVHGQGGAAIVAHPFQRTRHGVRRRNLVGCPADALEVFNSMLFTGYRNRKAAAFATKHDYGSVAGSDAHFLGNVGRAYTEVDAPASDVSADAVVDAIADGDTRIRGRRTPIHRSAVQYAAGAVKKSAYTFTRRAPYVPAWPASYRTD